MSVYLGVDFHTRTQTVCWCDQADGLVHRRTLDHQHDDFLKKPLRIRPQPLQSTAFNFSLDKW